MIKAVRKFFSILTIGLFLIFILIIGGFGAFVYFQKDNFTYNKEEDISIESQILGEATVDLDSRINNLEECLESSGNATLILTEFETEEFIKSFLSNSGIKWFPIKQDEFYLDFNVNTGYLHSAGPFDFDISAQITSEKTEFETYYPKIDNIMLGPIKLPEILSEKINEVIFQGIEQMKTQNFGNRKIIMLKFMQDKIVVEFESV